MYSLDYYERIKEVLQEAASVNLELIKSAAKMIVDAYSENKMLHVFGTGHSHILALELFYRAGGLVRINPILDEGLMLHNTATKSTMVERLPGYAACVLERYHIHSGDVMIICSNSGINSVPVEMALLCKERGLGLIALTNRAQSLASSPRHVSGARLMDLADIVLDNCCDFGDASIKTGIGGAKIGPASTVVGACLMNMIAVQVVEEAMSLNMPIDTYLSSNVEGGDERNAALIAEIRHIIPSL